MALLRIWGFNLGGSRPFQTLLLNTLYREVSTFAGFAAIVPSSLMEIARGLKVGPHSVTASSAHLLTARVELALSVVTQLPAVVSYLHRAGVVQR